MGDFGVKKYILQLVNRKGWQFDKDTPLDLIDLKMHIII
jgi:hypothetical protein